MRRFDHPDDAGISALFRSGGGAVAKGFASIHGAAAQGGTLRSCFRQRFAGYGGLVQLGPDAHQVFAITRSPPRLVAFSTRDGSRAAVIGTCGDADDLFVDSKCQRIYVSCGEGLIAVFERRDAGCVRVAQVPTRPGARTSLYVPELDRLFVAMRAGGGKPASIRIFRPEP